MPRYAQILSTGSYVPERIVTNAEIDAILGESTSEWLLENVGIRERRWMTPDQTTSDLVVEASRKALEQAGVHPEQINLIIVSTDTPDYLSPGTSVVVQHKLGAVNAGCYDVNSACAGWVTALDQGARYLMTEPAMNYVLVAGGYGMSRFLDFNDKQLICSLMGPEPYSWALAINRGSWQAIFSPRVNSTMPWGFIQAVLTVPVLQKISQNSANRWCSSSRNSPKLSTPNIGPS